MMTGVVRKPAVAGYYYPADPDVLAHTVDALAVPAAARHPAQAVLVPHGSIRQCGRIIAATLASLSIPRRCIILGPSHTAGMLPWSVMPSGAYRTPLGEVPIDEACVDALRRRCPFLQADAWAQRGEHAIEAVLPFLQRLGPQDLTLVPIVVNSDDPAECRQAAQALAQVVRMQEEAVLLIASADLSHHEPQERVTLQDRALMESICGLDDAGLIREARQGRSRMCGAAATACVLQAARALGAGTGRLVSYGTSAETGGDPGSAIGYAGIVWGSDPKSGV